MARSKLSGSAARNDLLKDWLEAHEAQCMWQQKIEYVGTLECWRAKDRIFLLQRYARDAGWEIYIPAHSGNSSLDALGNAAKYIRGEL